MIFISNAYQKILEYSAALSVILDLYIIWSYRIKVARSGTTTVEEREGYIVWRKRASLK